MRNHFYNFVDPFLKALDYGLPPPPAALSLPSQHAQNKKQENMRFSLHVPATEGSNTEEWPEVQQGCLYRNTF